MYISKRFRLVYMYKYFNISYIHQRDEGVCAWVFACTPAPVHVCTVACVRYCCMRVCVPRCSDCYYVGRPGYVSVTFACMRVCERAEMIRLLLCNISVGYVSVTFACMLVCLPAEMIRLLLCNVSHAIVLGILCVSHEITKACSQQKKKRKKRWWSLAFVWCRNKCMRVCSIFSFDFFLCVDPIVPDAQILNVCVCVCVSVCLSVSVCVCVCVRWTGAVEVTVVGETSQVFFFQEPRSIPEKKKTNMPCACLIRPNFVDPCSCTSRYEKQVWEAGMRSRYAKRY
jgi:hypothetical protein